MKAPSTLPRIVGWGIALLAVCGLMFGLADLDSAYAQGVDASPPDETVKLIFIHHSTGEAWLDDDDGGLGRALAENNYYVSDTNYGWGPDSVGDYTDIPDWPTWFTGPERDRYMAAVYAESDTNSWNFDRPLADPGRENQIIMFKSCFPNSELEGNPNDPPAPEGWLTVSNAKYVYNDLLNYFITRPDKLFVVITAPPVSDSSYADNARAFNNWLIYDWLAENDYPYSNVAVWDFYNVLTDPDNHHRVNNGSIEHIANQGGNTLYYPSGDDHPNQAGNRKATAEYVPMLNVFYHRWMAGAPLDIPTPSGGGQQDPTESSPTAISSTGGGPSGGLVDGFESGTPPGAWGWEAYWDYDVDTSITCAPESGMAFKGSLALHIAFDVVAESWSTCALFYDEAQDWRAAPGLAFYLHASRAGLIFDFLVYGGLPDEEETYLYQLSAPQESEDGWALIEVPWGQIIRADWEDDSGAPIDPAQISGLAFGFDGGEEDRHIGAIWVDEVHLMGAADTGQDTDSESETQPDTDEDDDDDDGGGISCPGNLGLLLAVGLGAVWTRRKRYR